MWKAIGWLLVFLFPLVMVYLTGGPDKEPLLDDHEYERRKRLAAQKKKQLEESSETPTKKSNKKNKKKSVVAKEQPVVEVEAVVEKVEPTKKKNKKNKKAPVEETKKAEQAKEEPKKVVETPKAVESPVETPKAVESPVETPKAEETQPKKEREIDEHMDPTPNYARVMRIRPEESDDDWESVPYEEGWSQVKSRRPYVPSKSNIDVNAEVNNVPVVDKSLDKKQRENLSRAQKKKEAKAAADKLQEERLRKHQKELEKIKIQEFYSSGNGKNTQWGKNGQKSSSKVPQSTASINEYGQLIWD